MRDALTEIGRHKVVPVVVIEDAERATALADALIEGGLPLVEVTFRTDAAGEVIRILAERGDLLVGAGTVLSVDQARTAIGAGARFMVSPGINPDVIRFCLDADVPITPGVCTPTDVISAMEMGLSVLKFFPAGACGGLTMLKAISAPFGSVRFIPTGGVNANNLKEYLAFPGTSACGGTWLATAAMIAEGRFDEIARLCREAVNIAAGTEN